MELSLLVARLAMEDVNKSQHIFQRDVTFDGVRRSKNVPSVSTGIKELSRCVFHFVDRAVRQRSLGGKPAVEREPAPISFENVEDIHNFGLERIEAI